MLIAAITAFLILHFSGHSSSVAAPFEQTAASIKKHVADETRQKQALALVDQMKTQSMDYMQRREKLTEALVKLTAKRATPVSEIESAAQPLIADDRATAEKLLDLRFQLKSVLTADEWGEVFPAPRAKPASSGKTTARHTTSHHMNWGLV
jgi:DNA helicase IV